MLRIRTRLAPSPIHGIGLFADEPVVAGTVIWELDPLFDLTFTVEDLDSLSPPSREQVQRYAFFDDHLGKYVLCGDDARFMNHAIAPNTVNKDDTRTMAVRSINVGDEVTCDYSKIGMMEAYEAASRGMKGESGAGSDLSRTAGGEPQPEGATL